MAISIANLASDFDAAAVSMESLCRQFDDLIDVEHFIISVEGMVVDVSMEENVYGSRPNALGVVAGGLSNKMYNRVKDGAGELVKGIGKAATGEYGIIEKAKAFATKLAKFINTVSTALSKVLATGFPLMGTIRKNAIKLREQAKSGNYKAVEGPVEVGKAAKYFAIDNSIPKPELLIKAVGYAFEVEETILSKGKLDRFKQLSENMLEPYRDSITRTRVDTLVMIMAVLATLTNPGAVAGVILKRIFSAANPGLGDKVEKVATVAGGVYGGVATLAMSMAGGGASTLSQMSKGRLDISTIPKFQPIYPFCKHKAESKSQLTHSMQSDKLPGNYHWIVTDYVDMLEPGIKGGVSKVGAKFEKEKVELKETELEALSIEQVIQVTELVEKMMAVAQDYCKQWPQFAKVYNDEYTRISDIVMTHSDDKGDEKKSATAHYVRYSYRNAMSVMLAGMWNNCFGADNQFVRYIVSLCRYLLIYCNKSLEESKSKETE